MSLLNETISQISPQDPECRAKAKARLNQLTMPHWALGRLMDLAVDLAGMTRSLTPLVERRTVVTMAADHGVVAEGVSKYPSEVTPQMVYNFVAGGAGINALARQAKTDVKVVDMGVAADLNELAQKGKMISKRVGPGTANIAKGPAMSYDQAVQAVEAGIEVARQLAGQTEIYGTGDMGIGNTTSSAAVICVLTGKEPSQITGRGTGIDDGQWKHKVSVIDQSLQVNKPNPNNGLEVLAKVGGFEIGGIAGLILGAAEQKKPVLVDGFISTAGALIAKSLAPDSVDYMIAAHRSQENGHTVALESLGKEPLLDLQMRLGEGTGAALAMNLVEAAARILTEVATFQEAGVSEADK